MIKMEMPNVSPILILGIGLFVLPTLSPVIHFNFPGWLYFVGIIVILIGVGHTIMTRV